MTEIMLRDTALACGMRYVMLRYFNVAGADVMGRTGQSTDSATHLIKVACEAALGNRQAFHLFGTDYETHDGSCIRDFIHVSDLVVAHRKAVDFLRMGGQSFTANCGYSQGYSVLEVLAAVQRVSGSKFAVVNNNRRPGDIPYLVANSHRIKSRLDWRPECDDLNLIIKTALEWESSLEDRRETAYIRKKC
jgi:UDP-glucose 4-epimerase